MLKNIKVGMRVRVKNTRTANEFHEAFPGWYPAPGTVGVVEREHNEIDVLVHWPTDSVLQVTPGKSSWYYPIAELTPHRE